ncbi:MAG: hypothetical protein M3Z04_08860 [Chloroflexota bacterium]|nr:hypothetical protein [Chloroflexota bacterium]
MLNQQETHVQTHALEIYTTSLMVRGTISLPFRRATEILNSADREFISLDAALIAPLAHPAQVSGPHSNTTLIRRMGIYYTATFTDPAQARAPTLEFAGVQKRPVACYGFLGGFVFHAHLHMRPGSTLLDVLETGKETFLPLTQATVYLVAHPDLPPRQHEVMIINRAYLDVMYLA